jgi:general secretion pathway protein N
LFGLLALAAIVFVLLWYLPARWVMPLLAPRLNGVRLEQVSGQLWDGRAGRVISAKGTELGQASWQLSRRALLGDNRLHFELHGPRIEFTGNMIGPNAADAQWTDVHTRFDLDMLAAHLALPTGQPRGALDMTASKVQLRGGWPVTLDARGQWEDAVVRTPRQGELPLGVLQLSLHASNGVIEGHLNDSGRGPLRIDGRLQLSPLARRFTAVAAPRGSVPALQRWLSGFGATDADGVTHINYTGGLAAALPEGKR